MPRKIPNVLSIAGSDPSGGAGVQADLKTFSALRCYGMGVVTALTVQDTRRVASVHPIAPEIVAAQIDAIFADVEVDAVKIGMLAQPEIADAVAAALARAKARNVVLDPVLAASSGDRLSGARLVEAINVNLAPLAALITPNLFEAAALIGAPLARNADEMAAQARALVARGARAALVKGGHLEGEPVDIFYNGGELCMFRGRRIETRNTHGTGCALSSAIAARLGHGADVTAAVAQAKCWLEGALAAADELDVGRGHGPLHHFHALWRDDA